MPISKSNYFFANLNVILILVGYPLVTSIFIPLLGNVQGSSQVVTIPFRLLSLVVALMAIILNLNTPARIPVALKVFLLFWCLVLLRMFYDLELRTDVVIFATDKQRIWQTAIFVCFIPMVSLIKSFKAIDFRLCLKYVYAAIIVVLIISFFFSLEDSKTDDRASGNIAFDTISFAQFGILAVIISIYKFLKDETKRTWYKLGYVLAAMLGMLIAFKTGSRGPLVALFVVLLFWYSNRFKNVAKAYLFFGGSLGVAFLSLNVIVYIIGIFSPLTAFRINEGLTGDDMSVMAREESYVWFADTIMENPLFGSQFARLESGQYPGYAHSILLDILLGFGVFGLLIFLYTIKKALENIRINLISGRHYWVGLIMLQYFILALTSGAYYSNPVLNCSIVLTLLISYKQVFIAVKN